MFSQSKKHANKVRRYISTRNEAEPEQKKSKPSTPVSKHGTSFMQGKKCHFNSNVPQRVQFHSSSLSIAQKAADCQNKSDFVQTRTNSFSCVFIRQTVTTETQTGWGPVIFATWRSPVRLWPSLTTRVKFMQRTWEWNLSTLRSQVSIECPNSSCVSLDEFGQVCYYDLFVLWTVASQKPSSPEALPKKMPSEDPGSMMETGDGNGANSTRFCSICQASFNNPLMAQQHYVGKRHRKQLTKQKLMETYGPSSAPGLSVATYNIAMSV